MSTDYFSSYSFEVPTDSNKGKTTYSFRGPKDQIDRLKARPEQVTNSYNFAGWEIQSTGYATGALKTTAQKLIGTRNIKLETTVSNKLAKFKPMELESDYDPRNILENTVSFVEINDRKGKTSVEFTEIDSRQEQPYERKFGNSSIIATGEFLKDIEFEKILSKIGDVE